MEVLVDVEVLVEVVLVVGAGVVAGGAVVVADLMNETAPSAAMVFAHPVLT